MTDHLIEPHGGALVNLLVREERALEMKAASKDWVSWDLTSRQICDLELLMNGGFSYSTVYFTDNHRRLLDKSHYFSLSIYITMIAFEFKSLKCCFKIID